MRSDQVTMEKTMRRGWGGGGRREGIAIERNGGLPSHPASPLILPSQASPQLLRWWYLLERYHDIPSLPRPPQHALQLPLAHDGSLYAMGCAALPAAPGAGAAGLGAEVPSSCTALVRWRPGRLQRRARRRQARREGARGSAQRAECLAYAAIVCIPWSARGIPTAGTIRTVQARRYMICTCAPAARQPPALSATETSTGGADSEAAG
jgi:hypothetical protein